MDIKQDSVASDSVPLSLDFYSWPPIHVQGLTLNGNSAELGSPSSAEIEKVSAFALYHVMAHSFNISEALAACRPPSGLFESSKMPELSLASTHDTFMRDSKPPYSSETDISNTPDAENEVKTRHHVLVRVS